MLLFLIKFACSEARLFVVAFYPRTNSTTIRDWSLITGRGWRGATKWEGGAYEVLPIRKGGKSLGVVITR